MKQKVYYHEESDGRKRPALKVKCDWCGVYFLKAKRFIDKHTKNYCSVECARNGSKKRVIVKCAWCGKKVEKIQSKLKGAKHGHYFCNRICKEKAQSINGGLKDIQPDHYNNGIKNYRDKAIRYYPNECEICGWDERTAALQVHHIDSNRENNDLENLIILCANHHWPLTLGIAVLEDRKFKWTN